MKISIPRLGESGFTKGRGDQLMSLLHSVLGHKHVHRDAGIMMQLLIDFKVCMLAGRLGPAHLESTGDESATDVSSVNTVETR